MFSTDAMTPARGRRVLEEHVRPAVHSRRRPVTLTAWAAPGEPVPFAEAIAAPHTPIEPGARWGAPWSTWWFELTATVAPEQAGHPVELVVDLDFDGAYPGFQCEGLVYAADGTPIKGVHPRNRTVRISDQAIGGEVVHLHLEAAANPHMLTGFAPSRFGDPATAPTDPLYTLGAIDLATFEPEVYALALDLEVLLDLAGELPAEDYRRHEVLAAVYDALTVLEVHDVAGTAAAARAALAPALAAPARASAQRLTAVGHAHIDTAWLWPIRETKRKVARTFANVVELLETNPELVFASSAAAHHAWLRDQQPAIWERVRKAVVDGSWELVGGAWVEADGVIPSGESYARQFLLGQQFFGQELGTRCEGVWLPDSFGYSAAYPQIARLAGAKWFLTQKMSWNDTNTFPHHTFWWEGIDGTRILTHFPPADTYNGELRGEELHRSVRQFREKGRSRQALLPIGYGDGGGGPTREMVERAHRLADLEGSPMVRLGTAASFFEDLRAEYADHAATWSGELYLELHRGTLTSQHAMKEGNRRCESLLRQAELVWSMLAVSGVAPWPATTLRPIWERVLTLQFHDILPGSSIAWVHQQARADYRELIAELTALIEQGLRLLDPAGDSVLNASPFDRREVVGSGPGQRLVSITGSTVAVPTPIEPAHPVAAQGLTLTNGLITARIDADGTIASLIDLRAGREVLPQGLSGAQLRLHPDVPAKWDAWDIEKPHLDRWDAPMIDAATPVAVVEAGPLRAVIEARATVGTSSVTTRYTLTADSPRLDIEHSIEWAERERVLASYLPVAVLAPHSSSEIQFGHLRRPTHENTSWEAARYEMVAHRWIHAGEAGGGWGVAVVNEATYGHHVARGQDAAGEAVTWLRLTLLRSPSAPDPAADLGHHVLRYAIVPGADVAEAIRHGYAMNLPLVGASAGADTGAHAGSDGAGTAGAAPARRPVDLLGAPLVRARSESVILEWVKLAEDGSGDVIVRLYESLGRRATAALHTGFDWTDVLETDLLEEVGADAVTSRPSLTGNDPAGRTVEVTLRPFQIVTLRLAR